MKAVLGLVFALLAFDASAQSHGHHAADTNLQQIAELTGSAPGQWFGAGVAVSGNTLVVGAPRVSEGCNGQLDCGAAYVYTASNGDWSTLTQVATLTQTDGGTYFQFGDSVAISGNTIVVSGVDPTTNLAAVYVFVEPQGGWEDATQTAELTVPALLELGTFLRVAIDGDTVVAGVPFAESFQGGIEGGDAYVFVRPEGGWVNMSPRAQLVATRGKQDFEFGFAVSVSGPAIIVGAPNATFDGASREGLAYLFLKPPGGWSGTVPQTTEFEASDGAKDWTFGISVSISGNAAVIGAPEARPAAAYIYTKPAGGWPKNMTESARLAPGKGASGRFFGYTVALSGNTAVIAPTYTGDLQGTAYVFSLQDDSERGEIFASDGAAGDFFGCSLAIGDGVIVVGADGYSNESTPGAAYVFGELE